MQIKRGGLAGRRDSTGHYLATLDQEVVRRSKIELDPRGAAALLGLSPSTIKQRCRQGRYPHADNDGAGWQIPVGDLLDE